MLLPGPGQYHSTEPSSSAGPSFSFPCTARDHPVSPGHRVMGDTPGPGHYQVMSHDDMTCESAPAFTMAGRSTTEAAGGTDGGSTAVPGPGAYDPVQGMHLSLPSAPAFSMRSRPAAAGVGGGSGISSSSPGPGDYAVDESAGGGWVGAAGAAFSFPRAGMEDEPVDGSNEGPGKALLRLSGVLVAPFAVGTLLLSASMLLLGRLCILMPLWPASIWNTCSLLASYYPCPDCQPAARCLAPTPGLLPNSSQSKRTDNMPWRSTKPTLLSRCIAGNLPGPGEYTVQASASGAAFTLGAKWHTSVTGGVTSGDSLSPGPCAYVTPHNPATPGTPAWTFPFAGRLTSKKCEGAPGDAADASPGPGAYDIVTPEVISAASPAFTMGVRAMAGGGGEGEGVPGPGAYWSNAGGALTAAAEPAWTMGCRTARNDEARSGADSPGPAAYDAGGGKGPWGPAWTMGGRHGGGGAEDGSGGKGPAPGEVRCREQQL